MREGSTQPRVAWRTPHSMRASSRVWWVSVLITNVTSRPRARKSTSLDASSRGRAALISIAVPVSTAFSQDRVDVELDAGAAADPPAREMGDGVDGRVLHRREDAPGLLGPVQLEVGVDAGHAPVEGAAKGLVVVDAAVAVDVQLAPVQQGHAGVARRGARRSAPVGRASCSRLTPLIARFSAWSVIARYS